MNTTEEFVEVNKTLIENIKKMNKMLAKKGTVDYYAVVESTTYETEYNEYGKGQYRNDGKNFETVLYRLDCSDCVDEDEANAKAEEFCVELEFLHDSYDTGRCIEVEVLKFGINNGEYNDIQHVVGEYNILTKRS